MASVSDALQEAIRAPVNSVRGQARRTRFCGFKVPLAGFEGPIFERVLAAGIVVRGTVGARGGKQMLCPYPGVRPRD
jgi:hypothetical protein